ncbi:tRNA-binding protein [Trachipleistophora hominis]|uniref:tRNA-binding protein n=1 Tax=Trachipleistophora hominis TaxID=72359 RepID=L7JZ26_TRAHO|nr:tRNA-binding protein [Trachipleistophora hominis]
MILSYTPAEEDLLFAISYLNLPIELQESDIFSLKIQDEEYVGIKNVMNQLISLCKCDPHDLDLLNDEVVAEIQRMRQLSPRKVLVSLTQHKKECDGENVPSNIPLHNYINGKFLTLADLVLFARVYKSIKEGVKYSLVEKGWFDEFQARLIKLIEFKEIEIVDFEMLDIRIGRIVDIKEHTNADSLYVEKVYLGNDELQVVSGLRGKMEMEDMKGKSFLFIVNMQKSKFRGEVSNGMILCAKDGDNLEVLQAPVDIPGEKLYLAGEKRPVIRNFNVPKISKSNEAFSEVMSELKIRNNKLVFKDKIVLCAGKEIMSKLSNASVS